MAKIVDDSAIRPRDRSYPWDKWFDGRTREFARGEDFVTAPPTFRNTFATAARKRGLLAVTCVAGDTVTARATKRETP
jgi:hypothetical protein